PYWMGYTAVDIGVFPGPLIVLQQPSGTPLSNGATRDFGTLAVGDAATMVFTIRNTGGLPLTDIVIGKDGADIDDFTVGAPGATTLATGSTTNFSVTFTPAATTPRTATLHIVSNAPDDNPFDIVLTGCGPFIYATAGGTVTITGYNGPGGEVTIPATINGLPVTSIGVNAFLNHTSLTSVTIPASVTSIGDAAFSGCTSLASLYFQGNAPILGSAVFDGEAWTTAYYLSGTTGWTVPFGGLSKTQGPFNFTIKPDNTITINGYTGPGGAMTIPGTIMGRPVTEIGSLAFYGYSNLTGVTIPNSVIGIGSYAFAFCTRLASVTIPDGVTNIDEGAFLNCTSLTGITLPASVTSIGDGDGADSGSGMFLRNGVFIGCTSLGAIAVDDDNPAFSSVDGVLFNKSLTTLIAYPGGMAGSYTVPAHVSSINFGAFTGATGLLGITVDAGHPVFSSVDGVLFNKDLTTLIACPGGKTGRYAIPAGVTRITDGAFGFCSSLTGITIPAGVTRIGVATFGFCSSLPAVTIPPGVTHIGTSAFLSCTSLTSVTIASTVTSIGEDAFTECARLTDIYFNGDAPDLGGDGYVFDWDSYATAYYLPGTTGWGGDLGGIWTAALPFNYTTSSGAATITGYTGYNDAVTIPSLLEDLPVTAVGDSAFYESALTSIMIPDSVTSIGDYAFEVCTNLQRVYFLGDAPSAGTEVFLDAADDVTVYCLLGTTGWDITFGDRSTMLWDPQSQLGFTTDGSTVTITRDASPGGAVNIPDMIAGLPVTDIGNYAFRDNINVTSVAIPSSVTSIGAVAFGGECPFLTEIRVALDNPSYCSVDGVLFNKAKTVLIAYPGGLVGDYTIPGDVTTIGSRAFDGCTYLYNVTIPDGVTDINDAAFMFCGNLTSVMIPKNVSSIGHFVFVGCANLYEILVDGDNPDYRSEDGVLFNDAMTSLIAYPGGRYADYTIPNGVTHIDDWAFALCSGLYSVLIPDSVTTIGRWAFYNCAWLTDVTIPHNVTTIGDYAFDASYSLSSAVCMGNAPTTMGIDVFTDTASGFTVYYYNGATGFTTPTWLGYDAYNMGNPPEIAVEQPLGTDLMDGGASILCGSVTVGDSSTTLTVTVKNVGTDDPTYGSFPLSNLDVTTTGANAADFFVTNVSSSTLEAGTSTTFTVTFTPTAAGARTAALHIASNDLDENPFDIDLTGIGMLPEIAVEQPAGTDLIDGSA
ncbi:MAG: leucine-rich repeat protein, partial [Verrucomicrobia bacterium]|nr:leucine-rich repeat protein [Verrucomicrobiota bacterium]